MPDEEVIEAEPELSEDLIVDEEVEEVIDPLADELSEDAPVDAGLFGDEELEAFYPDFEKL